jgi:hypothetical protein
MSGVAQIGLSGNTFNTTTTAGSANFTLSATGSSLRTATIGIYVDGIFWQSWTITTRSSGGGGGSNFVVQDV